MGGTKSAISMNHKNMHEVSYKYELHRAMYKVQIQKITKTGHESSKAPLTLPTEA